MDIEGYILKANDLSGGSRVELTYTGSRWYFDVRGYAPLDRDPFSDEPKYYDNPTTIDELHDYLDKCIENLEHMTTPSDTNLVLCYLGKEYVISENISQYEKIQYLVKEKEWYFWNSKILNQEEQLELKTLISPHNSIPSKGILQRKDDPNFYFEGQKYK